MFSNKNSLCLKCGYSEPAGSAHYVTYISTTLANFIEELGVKQIIVGNQKVTNSLQAMDPRALLPAILVNAQASIAHSKALASQLNLKTEDDPQGFYQKRVVATSSQIRNPAMAVMLLSESIYSAFKMSMAIDTHRKSKSLCLDLLEPISAIQVQDIQNYNFDLTEVQNHENKKMEL